MRFSSTRHRSGLALIAAVTAAGVLALSAAPSLASFHVMKVREVFPGSTAHPGKDYVELQMWSSGQEFVHGHTLTVYAANGSVADTATFPAMNGNVANGDNQSTILIGAASNVLGVTPDLVDSGLTAVSPTGGAVCWALDETSPDPDCMSWGNFTGFTGSQPSPGAGTPAAAITDGDALIRTIAPGCSTLLEGGDDTNDSATDFSLTPTPNPRNNATAPTETPCLPPNTKITSGPDGRTTDRTPTFEFKAIPAEGAHFKCKLDNGGFKSCTSPDTLPRLSFGDHTFRVKAINSNGADPTPAKQAFKVIRRN